MGKIHTCYAAALIPSHLFSTQFNNTIFSGTLVFPWILAGTCSFKQLKPNPPMCTGAWKRRRNANPCWTRSSWEEMLFKPDCTIKYSLCMCVRKSEWQRLTHREEYVWEMCVYAQLLANNQQYAWWMERDRHAAPISSGSPFKCSDVTQYFQK